MQKVLRKYKLLEEENKTLQFTSRDRGHKVIVNIVNLKQEAANTFRERTEFELKELQHRHVKLECHNRRGNMKFFEIAERENEKMMTLN